MRSAFHTAQPIFRAGPFATSCISRRAGSCFKAALGQKYGMQARTLYRSSNEGMERLALCKICPKRLVYGEQSAASQKTYSKAFLALGLGVGVTTMYFAQKIKKANEPYTPPNYAKKPARNLVFSGGGQKGIVYPAALKELERQGGLNQVKRVAGTSAGAITAALLAVGYSPDELAEIVDKNPLESFLDYKLTSMARATIKKANAILTGSTEAVHLTALHTTLWVAQKTIEPILPSPVSRYTKVALDNLGNDANKKRKEVLGELTKLPSVCEGEKFRLWMEEKIERKTGIKYCTFGELHKLAKSDPQKYKELYVFAAQLNNMDPAKVIRLGTTDEDPDFSCRDLIISDAIRCSMSIPVVFAPHKLYYKNALGGRSPFLKFGKLVDGGLIINFPIEIFDDPWKGANRRTLGLGFEVEKRDVGPVEPTVQGVVGAVYSFQEALDEIRPQNKHRMILIPTQGLGTIPKAISPEKKREVAEGARRKVEETFVRFRAKPDEKEQLLTSSWFD